MLKLVYSVAFGIVKIKGLVAKICAYKEVTIYLHNLSYAV